LINQKDYEPYIKRINIVFALLGQRAHNVTARVMKFRAVDCAVHVFYNTEKEKSQKRRIR